MKRMMSLVAATVIALSLASCSSSEPQAQPESTADPTVVPSDQGSASGDEDAPNDSDQESGQDQEDQNSDQDGQQQDSGQDESAKQDSDSQEKSKTDDAPESSKVTVSIDGQEKVVEPTDVYCSGSPGNIEHIIGKVNNQIPLIKVAGNSEFAMVKLQQQGPPEKANNPSNITFGQEWVTFKDTELGSATLNGSMVCTQWED